MSHKKHLFSLFLSLICMVSILFSSHLSTEAYAATRSFIVLNTYKQTLSAGDEYFLLAISSNGKSPSYSSSNSSVASVNTYGKITAKKAGSATITVKTRGGEAACKITVRKTVVTLSKSSIKMQIGGHTRLTAKVSTGHSVKWKSAKPSIASIADDGTLTAKKSGQTTITASVDHTSVTCKVTVEVPSVRLNKSTASLYRRQCVKLAVTSTSNGTPVWKSNKKSVATVDTSGNVIAIHHGTAVISVTVDGVTKSCTVTVKKPVITFTPSKITLNKGQLYTPSIRVSSGNTPELSSSNINIVSVEADGRIYARQKGKAYIYAIEDGTKNSLIVTVK